MKLHQCKISEVIENVPLLQLNGDDTVEKALKLMDGHDRHAVGIEMSGRFAGIFTYTDFIRKVANSARGAKHTCLVEVMTLEPVTIDLDKDCYKAFKTMCQHDFDHLPVIENNGDLVCVLSEEDLRPTAAKDLHKLETERDTLKAYIAGEGYMRMAG